MEKEQSDKTVVSGGFRQVLHEEINKDREVDPEVAIKCLEKGLRSLAVGGGDGAGDCPKEGSLPSSGIGLGNDFVNTGPKYIKPGESTDADKAAADDLKNQGNDAVMRLQFLKSLDCYTRAIALDGNNPVYFCNRSAVHVKLQMFQEALRDCQIAIQIQPSYAKAYGRMGVAYFSQNKNIDACLCYVKALALDPENEAYKMNLQEAQDHVAVIPHISGSEDQASALFKLETSFQNPNMANTHQLMQIVKQFNRVADGGAEHKIDPPSGSD